MRFVSRHRSSKAKSLSAETLECGSSTSGCSAASPSPRGRAELPTEIVHIARDPIDPAFDDDEFVRRARRRTSAIKRLLLDQGLISGVGNIYADEALWRARLHGERPGDRLTGPVLRDLLGHVRAVMGEALGQGGTSFDALYVNVNGESGYFDRSLDAYGQEGEPCRRCGTPIRRISFMNRSSFFCPRCQRPAGGGVDRPPPRWDSWRRPPRGPPVNNFWKGSPWRRRCWVM